MGIVTSNGQKNVKVFVENNNLNIFDYIFCDTSIFGKEKVLKKFLEQYSIAKENVMYIGDEIRDIQACQNVGIKIISVAWGFNSKEGLSKSNPDFLVNSSAELLELLKNKIN